MKKNKGFTLIELLITIVIVLSILLIAIVSINKISKAQKENAYELVKDEIEDAAEQYFSSNEFIEESIENGGYGVISLETLVNDGYLTAVTDPRDGKKIYQCKVVKFTKNDGKLSFAFDEDDTSNNCNESTKVSSSIVNPEIGELEVESTCENRDKNNEWCRGKKYDDNDKGATVELYTEKINLSGVQYFYKKTSDNNEVPISDELRVAFDDDVNQEYQFIARAPNGKETKISKTIKVDLTQPDITDEIYYVEKGKTINDKAKVEDSSILNNWKNYEGYYFSFNVTDGTSGPNNNKTDGFKSSNSYYKLTDEGIRAGTFTAFDKAGNPRIYQTTVKLDRTPPSTPNPTSEVYNSDIFKEFQCVEKDNEIYTSNPNDRRFTFKWRNDPNITYDFRDLSDIQSNKYIYCRAYKNGEGPMPVLSVDGYSGRSDDENNTNLKRYIKWIHDGSNDQSWTDWTLFEEVENGALLTYKNSTTTKATYIMKMVDAAGNESKELRVDISPCANNFCYITNGGGVGTADTNKYKELYGGK